MTKLRFLLLFIIFIGSNVSGFSQKSLELVNGEKIEYRKMQMDFDGVVLIIGKGDQKEERVYAWDDIVLREEDGVQYFKVPQFNGSIIPYDFMIRIFAGKLNVYEKVGQITTYSMGVGGVPGSPGTSSQFYIYVQKGDKCELVYSRGSFIALNTKQMKTKLFEMIKDSPEAVKYFKEDYNNRKKSSLLELVNIYESSK